MQTMNPTVEQFANKQNQILNELAEAVAPLKTANHPTSGNVQAILARLRNNLQQLTQTPAQVTQIDDEENQQKRA